jgi:threonine dehydratase
MAVQPIPRKAFVKARRRIHPFIWHTPLEACKTLSEKVGANVYLKMESWQRTGSFKIRGALNRMLDLSNEESVRGVITASAGNHGLGVTYAAELVNVRWRVVVPVGASVAKLRKLREYKGEVIEAGRDYDEAEDIAHQIERDCELTFIHAFDDPVVIAGQGTVGAEVLDDLPNVDSVVVPVGGGGLISGVALSIKSKRPQAKIIGVQSNSSPAMHAALARGYVVETPIQDTIADGLAGRFVSDLTLSVTKDYVDNVVLVEESEIIEAMNFLLRENRIIAEGAAAVGVAAVLLGKIQAYSKNVVILVTGRNIDIEKLATVLHSDTTVALGDHSES